MNQNQPMNLRMTVFTALFTALIIIGSYLSFPLPLTPVRIVLSDFFVMMAGLTLGAAWGAASVGMFLFIGAIGIPVFSDGKAGLAALVGPTGGFLLGFLVGVFIIGFISGRGKTSWFKDLIALIAGSLVIFGLGVPGLKLALKTDWPKALAMGLIPYIPGNVIKMLAAWALIQVLRPKLAEFIKNPATGVVQSK
jgi:biotin transport system substrate-specific component